VVTLRVPVKGERRVADAVLLILYGYRRLQEQDEVLTTRLMTALEVSGFTELPRIDRPVAVHIKDGLLIQAGRLKGTKYRLTNRGIQRAEEIIRSLLEQLA
jgi:hypothetical protein